MTNKTPEEERIQKEQEAIQGRTKEAASEDSAQKMGSIQKAQEKNLRKELANKR